MPESINSKESQMTDYSVAKQFKIGDWIRAKDGLEKGKTTTITSISENGYYGFYCGKLIYIQKEHVDVY